MHISIQVHKVKLHKYSEKHDEIFATKFLVYMSEA